MDDDDDNERYGHISPHQAELGIELKLLATRSRLISSLQEVNWKKFKIKR